MRNSLNMDPSLPKALSCLCHVVPFLAKNFFFWPSKALCGFLSPILHLLNFDPSLPKALFCLFHIVPFRGCVGCVYNHFWYSLIRWSTEFIYDQLGAITARCDPGIKKYG